MKMAAMSGHFFLEFFMEGIIFDCYFLVIGKLLIMKMFFYKTHYVINGQF